MKKIIFCFLLIFSSIVLFANDITKADIIGKEKRFQINHSWVYIEFINENKYTFFSPFGGYLYREYNYTLTGNKLTLEYCDKNIWYLGQDLQPLIFPEKKDVTYEWDSEYLDFYCIGAFVHGKTIFINFETPTPVGTECILDDVKVIKQDSKKSFLIAKENLRIRKEPSLSAETGTFNYSSYFNPYALTFKNYEITDHNICLPLLLTGLVVYYDAVTVEKQTIDGITAPWYRIEMYDHSDEGSTQYFWVFGGYIEKVVDKDNPKYEKLLIQTALDKGILKK